MRVVDIQLNALEKTFDFLMSFIMAIQKILGFFLSNLSKKEKNVKDSKSPIISMLKIYIFLYSNQILITCLVTVIVSKLSSPGGLLLFLELSKMIVTVALLIPAFPALYISSSRLFTLA